MHRGLIITILLFLISSASHAQKLPLDEEDNQFNLSSGYTTTGIPVYLGYELMVYTNISFTAEVSARFYNESTDSASYGHTLAGLSFYGNYYFNSLLNMSDKMGLYGGIHFSYYKWFSPEGYVYEGKGSSTLAAGAQLGYRYYFKNIGVFVEGIGDSQYVGGRLGVSYKFQ